MSSRIQVRPIDPKDVNDIVEFFKIDFVKNEPICHALGDFDSKAFDMWVMRTAVNGLSFEAIDTSDNNKRVGAYLCTNYQKGKKNPIDIELESFPDMDQKMATLCEVLDGIHDDLRPEIFRRFGIDEYLEGVNLSVLPGYTGHGIAGALTQAIEDRAREVGIPMVYVCCSSEYTARVVQKRNYELIHTLAYEDIKKNGERLLHTPAPHVAIKCYVKPTKGLQPKL